MVSNGEVVDVARDPVGRLGIVIGTEPGICLLVRARVVDVVAQKNRERCVGCINGLLHIAKI